MEVNTIKSYIFDNKCKIDGHVHLFDKNEFLGDLYRSSKNLYVGFADYSIRHIDEYKDKMLGYYDNFIKKHYKPFHKRFLLACAPTIQETIEIYESHKDVIRGFGELKVHKICEGGDYNILTINELKKLYKYSEAHGNLPIYTHYTLSESRYIENLKNILKQYPTIPTVLCHCGMEDGCDLDEIYYNITAIQLEYTNLWLDISYIATDYFIKNPFKLTNIALDRCILGSDINPQIFHSKDIDDPKKFCDTCYINYEKLKDFIKTNDNNVLRLFKGCQKKK